MKNPPNDKRPSTAVAATHIARHAEQDPTHAASGEAAPLPGRQTPADAQGQTAAKHVRPQGRLRLIAHRPGPGYSDAVRRGDPFPVLLPDETAMLFRNALAYAQHAFRPKLHDAPDVLLPRLLASAACGGFRDAAFDARQEEEFAFQAEALVVQDAGNPWAVSPNWRDRQAVPRLHLLQDLGVLDPYEYGLIYLLMHTMDRRLSRTRMLSEIRALIRSWNTTMEPGQGVFSLTVLRIILRAYAWWTRLPKGQQHAHAAMVCTINGTLEGACSAVSGQHLMARRRIDWNRAHLAMMAGGLAYSLPALPKMQRWHQYWRQGGTDEHLQAEGLGQTPERPKPERTRASGRVSDFKSAMPPLKAVAEPRISLRRKRST